MQISGVLVHTRPECAPAVQRRILEVPGTAIHATSEYGRLIVTIEGEDGDDLSATFQQVAEMPGVLSTALVYHYCDPLDPQEM